MKRLALLFSCSAALVCAADLSNVHTVYLLKMSKGLDQYLANRLTAGHIFQIVTDPKLADAVFTDQIGEGFQLKLEELYPTPEAEKPKPALEPQPAPIPAPQPVAVPAPIPAPQPAAIPAPIPAPQPVAIPAPIPAPKPAPKPAKPADVPTVFPLMTETVNKLSNPAANSGFGRAKGTVFLVDAKSRQVVWSAFQPAKDGTSQEMDRTAKAIVARVTQSLHPKK